MKIQELLENIAVLKCIALTAEDFESESVRDFEAAT